MTNSIVDKNVEYYRLIKESLSEHKLAFFVGSGESRASASGDTYPLWSDILKKLQLPADGEEQKLHLVNLVGILVFVRDLGDFLAEGAHAFHDLFVACLRNAER